MKRLITITAVLALTGCTSLSITQKDESPGERTITTTVRGSAWFSSSSAIAKLKALQTDKTQSVGADTIGQQGATNTVAALVQITRILELIRPVP